MDVVYRSPQQQFKHHRLYVKILTLVSIILITLPSFSWTFDQISYPTSQSSLPLITHLGQEITIPNKFGTIEKSFQGGHQTVICVQDLHCHYEVQKNIASIIGFLNLRNDLKLIGEEGAFDSINMDVVKDFPLKNIRREVADAFVKRGRLTGAEYFMANHDQELYLEGIEYKDLYDASNKVLQGFLNAESQGYCFDIRDVLEELKTDLYNPLLFHYDQKRVSYYSGELDLLKYALFLKKSAKQFNLNLARFTTYTHYLQINKSHIKNEIRASDLFQEIEQIDQLIREQLYTDPIQGQLDQLISRLDLIEKLLNISVNQQELDTFKQNKEDYQVGVFLDFIERYNPDAMHYFGAEINNLNYKLEQVEQFYDLADQRSLAFVDKLLEKMETKEQTIALMVSGGFHIDEILASLKEKNISYVSIKPHINRQDIINPYFSLLQGKKSPLERLLAKHQTIFAPRVLPELPQFRAVMEASYKPIALLELDLFTTGAQSELQAYLKKHQFIGYRKIVQVFDDNQHPVTIPEEVRVFQGQLSDQADVGIPFVITKNYPDISGYVSGDSVVEKYGPYQVAILSSEDEIAKLLEASTITTRWIDTIQQWLQKASWQSFINSLSNGLTQAVKSVSIQPVWNTEAVPTIPGGIIPRFKEFMVNRGMDPKTYDTWAAMIENNFLYAAGLVATLAVVISTGADISQVSRGIYAVIWLMFPLLHFWEGKVEQRSWINIGLATIISALNLGLLYTPASMITIIILSYLSHGLINYAVQYLLTSKPNAPSQKSIFLQDLLDADESGTAWLKSNPIGESFYQIMDEWFISIDQLVEYIGHVKVQTGDRFDISDIEKEPGQLDLVEVMTQDDASLLITIPTMYGMVLNTRPKKGVLSQLRYAFQSMVVRSVITWKLLAYIKETKRLNDQRAQTEDAETLFEYYGERLLRLPLNILRGIGQQLGLSFYQSGELSRPIGVTRAEFTKLIESYRQQIEQAPSIWSIVYPNYQRLLDAGNAPAPEVLLEALEKIDDQTLERLVPAKQLDQAKLRVARLQKRWTLIKNMKSSDIKVAEINHLIALIAESKQGLKAARMLNAQQIVEKDQLSLLVDDSSLRDFKAEINELMDRTENTALFGELAMLHRLLKNGGSMTKVESARLQSALESISLKDQEQVSVYLDEGLTRFSGLVLNGRVNVVPVELPGVIKEKVQITQPIITNVLADDLQTITSLGQGEASLKKVAMMNYTGVLPESIPIKGNFNRDLAKYLRNTPGFKHALGINQPLARSYHIYMNDPTERNHRHMARVIGRILKRQAKQALLSSDSEQYRDFQETVEAVNQLFRSRKLFGEPLELGHVAGNPFFIPRTLRFGGQLAFMWIARQYSPEFVINKQLDRILRQKRLKKFRMNSAA